MFNKIKKTNGCIWLELNDNTYIGILLDNFPELHYAGYTLLTEYTSLDKISILLSLGNLIELKEFPNEDLFNNKDTYHSKFICVSHYNKYQEPPYNLFSNSILGTKKANYSYLFKDNLWYFNLKENYQLLTHEIIEDFIENPINFYEQYN